MQLCTFTLQCRGMQAGLVSGDVRACHGQLMSRNCRKPRRGLTGGSGFGILRAPARCLPHLVCRIGVDRRNGKPDDHVGPDRGICHRQQHSADDGDIGQGIVAG